MPGIDECLLEAMALPGARGAALVDWSSGLALGTVGESPVGDHETTAAETAELARAAAEYETFAATSDPAARPAPGAAGGGPGGAAGAAAAGVGGPPVEDLIVTTRTGYHVLRFVATSFDSSVFLHLWLDRAEGNLALARMRLRDLAEGLVLR
ncbi:hypothetical protein [Streptomyces antimicrobicus]|uniref:Roadblock/LAMTOR2 domain-containing protein n=1 Tax=Streptomyces antimicrobicus TaxID=2883108 RepID=A0ABS8B8Z0_9ACTN|nr:hypothetical protein [Streptomyces antimicrobicus]MCB5181021.1 hypothetical protein [Streptomyces antimicrobicus]